MSEIFIGKDNRISKEITYDSWKICWRSVPSLKEIILITLSLLVAARIAAQQIETRCSETQLKTTVNTVTTACQIKALLSKHNIQHQHNVY